MQKKLQIQKKIINFKKILIILLLGLSLTTLSVSASSTAFNEIGRSIQDMMQEKKINLSVKDKLITDILSEIRRQSGIGFIIHESVNPKEMGLFTINVSNASVKEVLDILLKDKPYQYEITDNAN